MPCRIMNVPAILTWEGVWHCCFTEGISKTLLLFLTGQSDVSGKLADLQKIVSYRKLFLDC